MRKGKSRRTGINANETGAESERHAEIATKLTLAEDKSNELTEKKQIPPEDMSDLETVLSEIRAFRRENAEAFKEIQEEIKKTNNRVEEAERRITESEDRLQTIEGATLELLELQKQCADRLKDQESRARRDNIRIHGIKEQAENGATSMIVFIESLLKEKLELPTSLELNIERAHRALAAKPQSNAPPRSIVVKFQSYRMKEEIVKAAWQKKGFEFEGRKIIIDHDYAPEILRQRKEYGEAKRVLKDNKVRFQTPFPAKLRVFYEGETVIYNTAEEATKDMITRGFQVTAIKSVEDAVERIKRLTWRQSRAPSGGRRADIRPGYIQRLQAFRRTPESTD